MTVSGWDASKMYRVTIDNNLIESPLQDFPVLLNITSSGGATGLDLSGIFTELDYPWSEHSLYTYPSSVDDSFTAASGTQPDTEKWLVRDLGAGTSTVEISNNQLNCSLSNDDVNNRYVTSKYQLSGDFDIQVDYSILAKANTDVNLISLRVDSADATVTNLVIERYYKSTDGGDAYLAGINTNGLADVTNQTTTTSDTTGKFRITRSSTTVTLYYWSGASWAQLNTYSSWNTNNVFVSLRCATTTAQTYEAVFDNFVLNSGTIVWPTILEDFTAQNNAEPNREHWYSYWSSPYISGNKLKFDVDSSNNYKDIISKFTMSGDFDVQVDFNVTAGPDTEGWYGWLRVVDPEDIDARARIGIMRSSRYEHAWYIEDYDASDLQSGGIANYATTGKLRVSRVSGVLTVYYWWNDSWVSAASSSLSQTNDMRVEIITNNSSAYPTASIDFDDLSITADSLVWPETTESFTGVSGTIADVDRWYTNIDLFGTAPVEATTNLQDSVLRIDSTAASENIGSVFSKFRLSGDFDICVNVPDISSATSTTAANLYMWYDLDNRAYVGFSGALWRCNSRINGAWDTEVTTARSSVRGAYRLVRTGSSVACMYKEGYSNWNTLQTFTCTTEDCAIVLYSKFETTNTYIDFDDVIVNSGTLLWPNSTFPNREKLALEYKGYSSYYIEDVNDDFTGTSVNSYLWSEEGSANSSITQSGTLNLAVDNTSTGYARAYSNYALQGDFDVNVEIDLVNVGTTASWTAGLYFKDANTANDSMFMFIRHNGSTKYYSANCQIAGSWQTEQTSSTTDTRGILRITRFNSSIRAYYKSGTVWTNLASWDSATTEDIIVRLHLDTVTNTQTAEVAFDNLLCKSEGIDWGGNTPRTVLKQAPVDQQCYMEIESWDQTNSAAKIWAKIPEVSSESITNLRLYYDKDAPTTRSGISSDFNLIDWSKNVDLWRDGFNTGDATISGASVTLACEAVGYNEITNLVSNFGLSGDFDIQIDMSGLSTSRHVTMYFWYDINNRGYVGYNHDTLQCVANSRIDGTWDTEVQTSFSNTYGSLRLIRVGSLIYSKYKDGAGNWTDLTNFSVITSEIMVVLHGNIDNSAMSTSSCVFSNFVINSADSISGYIGNSSSIPGRSLWYHNFMGVYHMAQDPAANSSAIIDSTIGSKHATPVGTWASSNLTNGQTTKALYFSGTDQYLELNEVSADLVGKDITVDVSLLPDVNQPSSRFFRLFQINTSTGGNRVLMNGDTYYDDFDLFNDVVTVNTTSGIVDYTDGNNVSFSYSVDTDGVEIFVDGTENTGAEVPAILNDPIVVASNDLISIGQDFDGATPGEFYAGKIQEVRVSDTIRSNDWRKATALTLEDSFLTFRSPVSLYFSSASPDGTTDYGFTSNLSITVTVSGIHPSYLYDLTFYDGSDNKIGSTVSGTSSGQPATGLMSTPSGINYSWYAVASSSGVEDTSDTYIFSNRFLAAGTVTAQGVPASGTLVRLHRRNDGSLVGEARTTSSGTFTIDTPYTDEHYCIAFHDDTSYNALIYDHVQP